MGTKKKKSNKHSSYSAGNYSGEGASWLIFNTNISLIKKLRSNSLPPDSHSDHHTTSPNHKANSQLKPSPSNPRLNKLKEGNKSTHDPTTMNIGGSDDEDESKEIYSGHRVREKGTSLSTMSCVQCLALALSVGLLVASFYVDKLKQYEICSVLLWK